MLNYQRVPLIVGTTSPAPEAFLVDKPQQPPSGRVKGTEDKALRPARPREKMNQYAAPRRRKIPWDNDGFPWENLGFLYLVGGLEYELYDFPYIGNDHPN